MSVLEQVIATKDALGPDLSTDAFRDISARLKALESRPPYEKPILAADPIATQPVTAPATK